MDDNTENEPVGSSRIYIAGLPPYLDEKRLRDIFSERGEVTDAKIMRTRDGRSRQFGFVGFQSVDQAGDAIHYFDKSYIDTSRLQVKYAEKAQSSNLQRPWSVHSKGSSAHLKRERAAEEGKDEKPKVREMIKQKRARFQTADPAEGDPGLQEFLKVMQPRNKAAVWANDDAVPGAAEGGGALQGKRRKVTISEGEGSDGEGQGNSEEEFQDLSEVRPKGKKRKAAVVLEDPDVVPPSSSRKNRGPYARNPSSQVTCSGGTAGDEVGEAADPPGDALVTDTAISDLDYLKSRVRSDAFADDQEGSSESEEDEEESEAGDDSEEDDEDGDSEGSDGTGVKEGVGDDEDEASDSLRQRRDSHQQAGQSDRVEGEEEEDQPPILQTGRLFLRNLPYQATEADLASLFEEYGELSEVHLVVDRSSRKSKGFALVQFIDPEEAQAAAAALDGSIFQGRLLHILPAKPAPTVQDGAEVEEKSQGFKQQRSAEQKANAGNRAAWNTLFMRADTVAEAIAAHYGVTKAQLLDKDAADLPVRMALGEAHVIAMTKQGLAQAGVDVASLEQSAAASGRAAGQAGGSAVERSGTVLLVKNLPYSATEEELLEAFAKAGNVARLVLPETKTLALVEYQQPAEARRAFKTLAFKRFQAAPLFLEWAPAGVFASEAPPPKLSVIQKDVNGANSQKAVVEVEQGGGDDDAESRSIYVKNLAWATEDKALAKHFDGTVSAAGGSIRAAKVTKRKGPDGKLLSAGYGFVECSSEAAARVAVKKLQGSMLGGHKLNLQLSMKKDIARSSAAKKAGKDKDKNAQATKVVVRNVAFEATSKEIRALFQPFGQIKSVRLPRKFDNSHRGFAFVDFLSHQEAVNAMEAVAGTHLYGRRLVTEWADQDEGLDELRAKTAAKSRAE